MPKEKDGNNYLMCITDRLSKIIEAIATKSTITAKETAILLYENWYLKGFGLPKSIVSDRDVKFTSQVWTEFCKLVGIEQKMSTSRHQQTDGQSESSIKILETALRKIVNHKKNDWASKLKYVVFAYNNSIHSATGFTPFYLMQAYQPKTFPDIVNAIPRSISEQFE